MSLHAGWKGELVTRQGVWCVAWFLVTLLWIVSCSHPPDIPVRKAEEGITLQRKPSRKGMDLVLLLDESGSMYGERGTDPQGLRYEAGKYLVQNLLVKEADPDFPHRISIIHFGDVALSHPLTDLVPAKAEELAKRILHTSKHLGDTSFIEALREARKVADAAPPYKNRRELILVIFTDGEPDDKRRLSLGEYFREIHGFRQKALEGAKLYVIGIDKTLDHIKWVRSQKFWEEEVGKENIFFITEMKELYAKYNEVVRRLFELPQVSPDVVSQEVPFEVLPYLEKLEFHIFPESEELQLGIVRPDQTLVRAADKGVAVRQGKGYDILTLAEPPPGLWKYKLLKGRGRVLALRNPIPFKLNLLEPEDVHPLGKSMLLKAQFTHEGGKDIAEHPNYPLAFTARVTTPKAEEIQVQFLKERKLGDVYYADKSISVQEPGKYVLKLTVKGGTKFETTSTHETFVYAFPYLEISRPALLQSYPMSHNFTIAVALKRGAEATDPEKEFETHPNSLILAQLKAAPYATEPPAVWLTQEGKQGVFRGVIPQEFRQTGRYTIAFQLAGTPRVSDRLRPPIVIERVDFFVRPSLWQEIGQWGQYVLIGVVIGGVVWMTSLTAWLSRVPKIMASIDIREEGSDVIFTRYMHGKFLKPTRVPAQAGRPLVVWVRAKDADSLYLTRGGLISFLTFGLFGRRFLLHRNEERDLDATRRVTFS